MEKERLRPVGYRRVSMREQIDGHSLDAQEKNIRDYADHNNWELVGIDTDAGISAMKDSHRPALEKLMEDARAGHFDVILVDKVDRFYRHLAGLLTALDDLRSINVSFLRGARLRNKKIPHRDLFVMAGRVGVIQAPTT
jgi:site-specific DNA recombinase